MQSTAAAGDEIVDETDVYVHIERRDHATAFNRRHVLPINEFRPRAPAKPAAITRHFCFYIFRFRNQIRFSIFD